MPYISNRNIYICAWHKRKFNIPQENLKRNDNLESRLEIRKHKDIDAENVSA